MSDGKIYYIDFSVSGVLKVDTKSKALAIEKIQAIILEALDDSELPIIRVDTTFDIFSEDELMGSFVNPIPSDEEDFS